jgi:hypothetical protein
VAAKATEKAVAIASKQSTIQKSLDAINKSIDELSVKPAAAS